ncbi:MAG TPA: CDC27 family protein [Bryobacteraceae bacterium]
MTDILEALKASLDQARIIEKLKEFRYEEALGIPPTATNAEATAAFVRLSARYAGEEPVRIALNKARGAMLAESDLERGRRLAWLGNREAAAAFFRRAVAQDDGLEANRALGRTLAQLNRDEEAFHYLEQAALLGDQAEDYHWLGATLANAGKYKAALNPLREAARRRGSCADHEWLAKALLALGRLAESLPHLRRIVELRDDPEDRLRLDETLAELASQASPEPATASVAASQPGEQLELFQLDPTANGTARWTVWISGPPYSEQQ